MRSGISTILQALPSHSQLLSHLSRSMNGHRMSSHFYILVLQRVVFSEAEDVGVGQECTWVLMKFLQAGSGSHWGPRANGSRGGGLSSQS